MPHFLRVVRTALVRSGRGFDRAARVCASLAAATLSTRDIRVDAEHEWGRFHAFDDDIDRGLFDWEERLINRFVGSGDRVLIVGCGTGRDVIAMSARGHDVCGVDPAPRAIDIAREACERRKIAATLIHGYVEDVALPGPFDVIMFSYLCYSYIPESTRRVAVLRRVKAELAPGGRIFVSCPVIQQRRRSRLFDLVKMGARLRRSDWHPEDGDVIDPMSAGEPRFHYEHLFVAGEVEAEAQRAGLRVSYSDRASSDYQIAVLTP